METPVAVRFAEAVRRLTAAGRALGLEVPAFRSPPRTPGAARVLRRYSGGAVVAVTLRNRAFESVLSDMVDGVLAANRRSGPDAGRLRTELLAALDVLPPPPTGWRAPDHGVPSTVSPEARVAEWHTQAA